MRCVDDHFKSAFQSELKIALQTGRDEDNGSSDPVYSYERYRVSIGVSRLF
jgi:hypothetical protein